MIKKGEHTNFQLCATVLTFATSFYLEFIVILRLILATKSPHATAINKSRQPYESRHKDGWQHLIPLI